MENKKVLLGMSGGVDSSVAAILLKNQGYDVTGITLKLHGDNDYIYKDAKKVCDDLNIEHISADYTKEFKEHVVDYFIEKYSKCLTPNPCIECNKYLKFGVMFEEAKKLGCKYVATGHYASVEYSQKYKRYVLRKAKCISKDQSYVLWKIPKEYLQYILFPLTDFSDKSQIRQIASDNGLEIANKKESEDICFIPDGNYKDFLEKNSNLKPCSGDIVMRDGKVLGKHKGIYYYTVGQRRGLAVSYKVPLFVTGFNSDKNQVLVGEEKELYKKEMYVKNINLLLIDELNGKMDVNVKVRYRSKEENAQIEMVDKDMIKVTFESPVARITPGQSAVFYVDDIVLGGGEIVE